MPPQSSAQNKQGNSMMPVIGVCVVLLACIVGSYLLLSNQLKTVKQQTATLNKLVDPAQVKQTLDSRKYQAVFMSSGVVYFGKLTLLNNDYAKLTGIYYLQTNGGDATAAAKAMLQDGVKASDPNDNSTSLIKLGCELHQPYDEMTINRSRIDFWENIHDSSQVVQAIKTFQQQNPNGQKCTS